VPVGALLEGLAEEPVIAGVLLTSQASWSGHSPKD
jgi:hypothetical protein